MAESGPPAAHILSEWELWACAHEAVKQHALDAPIIAATRADGLEENGDLNGAINWRLIGARIDQLLSTHERQPS